MSYNKNRTAPKVPFTSTHTWLEFMDYLANKYVNGLLLPDFPADPPNVGNEYRMYFNTTINRPKFYNGTIWIAL